MLHYITRGNGPNKIIFIHGNSQTGALWEDVFTGSLCQKFQLIAIDLPGHGHSFRSNNPDSDYTLKNMADAVKILLVNFGEAPFILVGNSLGTNIIGEMAPDIPNCRGIVFTGSSIMGNEINPENIIRPNPNVEICFTAEYTSDQLNRLIDDAAFEISDNNRKKLSDAFKFTDPSFRVSLSKSVSEKKFSDELGNIRKMNIPVAVIYGDKENLCFTDALDKVDFPKWKNKTIILKNSGHCPQLDQPEELARIIQEYALERF